MTDDKGSIPAAILWMIFLSLILFWLPVIGSLIAGIVGGKKAGSATRGFLACLIPALILSFGVLFVFTPFMPGFLIGLIGSSMTIGLLLSNIPLICGAIIGGAMV